MVSEEKLEIWKDVIGFERFYKVSNLGNVKSLGRYINHWKGGVSFIKERKLKKSNDNEGYLLVGLSKNGICKTYKVHRLVVSSFISRDIFNKGIVVNHIDFNKSNNKVENLEVVTNRENTNKKHVQSSSNFVGVSWHKRDKKWSSNIFINDKPVHLGYFNSEIEASLFYQTALIDYNNGLQISKKTKDIKGVFWHKSTCKWRVRFRVNGKDRHFGLYLSEEEAMRKYKELFNNYKSLY